MEGVAAVSSATIGDCERERRKRRNLGRWNEDSGIESGEGRKEADHRWHMRNTRGLADAERTEWRLSSLLSHITSELKF